MMSDFTVAVVGVGAVGAEMVRVLKQRRLPMRELRLLARSSREIDIDGERYPVKETTPEAFDGVNIALFAGTEGEKGAAVTFSQAAIDRGSVVIDNGSEFRMAPRVPLVVPGGNGAEWERPPGILTYPDCPSGHVVRGLQPHPRPLGRPRGHE